MIRNINTLSGLSGLSGPSGLNLEDYSELEIITSWLRVAFKNDWAVALWRLPGTTEKQLVIDTSACPSLGKIDLEESGSGFLFAPFENQSMSQDIFLRAHVYYTSHKNRISISNNSNALIPDNIIEQLGRELESKHIDSFLHLNNNNCHATGKEQYIQMVEHALSSIRNGTLQKVVPSASRKVKLQHGFDSLETFERMCNSYPEAFISLVTAPGLGTWMGASPEPLIELDQLKTFTTVALAGTQAYNPATSLQDVAWKQKEIEEQALVSRYIINCFKKIRLREFEEIGPKTVVAGNLLHLKTTYSVDMDAINFPLLGSVMLDLLHPTSAVCGMPKEPALEFIKQQENFDRVFFSGYLGPVNLGEETHLFVNLRCMQIGQEEATLYAGAGVTEDSIPQNEWEEIQLKCDTLIDVLDLQSQKL
jgi:isochorismate synthase